MKESPESSQKESERVTRSAEEEKETVILATGLEDYGRWKKMFKDRSPENDPPYRRGRIWA